MTQAEVVMQGSEYKMFINILKPDFPALDTYVLTHYFLYPFF